MIPGFPWLIPYFFTTLSTEKVNKIVRVWLSLFITPGITVSYSNVIRSHPPHRVVYRFQRV
ncbi:TPA: hypothetical protein JD053_07030 [Klebsiella michiganensis]|uniref:Uncharacterized protein n=1 Tax=Klebsiella michiganensis TaxID=1134687 RepID=A0A1Q8YR64_9ENTR|nr:hypothetical protein AGH21_12540 [Klebsiella oxytoca]ASK73791.1 hypothetical protein CF000_12120 [Klebsiella michiganensis]KAB5489106.1 hypothetical protein F8562_23720 [Klebsiella sp. RCJ4]NCB88491.1 hypothetical protein [Gammaproteobacteria bacterium]TWW03341.1 hypothetical protein FQK12_23810 [Klebsiella sp. ME-303]